MHRYIRWYLLLASFVLLVPCALAQVRVSEGSIPAEHHEAIRDVTRNAALALDLKPAERLDALLEAYRAVRPLSPGHAATFARMVAHTYDDLGRVDDSTKWFGIAAAEGRREGFTLSPSPMYGLMQGQRLIGQGRFEEAAEAMMQADDGRADPYVRYELLREAGHAFAEVGRPDDVAAAITRAVEQIQQSDRGTLAEEISARQFLVDHGPLAGETDKQGRLQGYLEIHNDPRYADEAARLMLISRVITLDAAQLGEWDLLEDVSEQVLKDVMRMGQGLDADAIRNLRLDQAYLQTSLWWSLGLRGQGRHLEAMEVLEAALEAFPDSQFADALERALHHNYDDAGVRRKVGDSGLEIRFGVPDGVDVPDGELIAVHTVGPDGEPRVTRYSDKEPARVWTAPASEDDGSHTDANQSAPAPQASADRD
jgi:tetratricopeptide (TPR) repeat protein